MNLLTSIISHPVISINDPRQIKNIIFDFGNVICNIDVKRTEQAFNDLGMISFRESSSVSSPVGLFGQFELGAISPETFRDGIRAFYTINLNDKQIDDAWNALLLDIPPNRIKLMESLRQHYRLFILSNSNKIHYDKYSFDFSYKYGYSSFNDLFEHAWFSFDIGLNKPHHAVFDYVLGHSGLNPEQTLFIDDTLVHVKGANQAGIHAHHLDIGNGQDIVHLFQ